MAQNYLLTVAARAQLKNIGEYTEQRWGIEQQRIYLGQLFKRFEEIGNNPLLGRERLEIAPGIRSVMEGRHVIYYQVTDMTVEILAVLHGRMDLKRELTRSRERNVQSDGQKDD